MSVDAQAGVLVSDEALQMALNTLSSANATVQNPGSASAIGAATASLQAAAATFKWASSENLDGLVAAAQGVAPEEALSLIAAYFANETTLLEAHEKHVDTTWTTLEGHVGTEQVLSIRPLLNISVGEPGGLVVSSSLASSSVAEACPELTSIMAWVKARETGAADYKEKLSSISEAMPAWDASHQTTSGALQALVITGYDEALAVEDVAQAELNKITPIITDKLHCPLKSGSARVHDGLGLTLAALLLSSLAPMFL